jgi:transposase
MPTKACPNETLMSWAEDWARERKVVDWQKLLPPWEVQVLPRRWVGKRSFAWLNHNRRMSNDCESFARAAKRASNCYDPPYGRVPGLLMRLFHTVSLRTFGK